MFPLHITMRSHCGFADITYIIFLDRETRGKTALKIVDYKFTFSLVLTPGFQLEMRECVGFKTIPRTLIHHYILTLCDPNIYTIANYFTAFFDFVNFRTIPK